MCKSQSSVLYIFLLRSQTFLEFVLSGLEQQSSRLSDRLSFSVKPLYLIILDDLFFKFKLFMH